MATSDLSTSELAKVNWRGPALPFLSKVGGHYVSKSISDLIRSSIYMILTTKVGTRPWRPEFGSLLPSLVFGPDDEVLAATVRAYSVEAIQRWEPRIRLVSVNVVIEQQDNTMTLDLQYVILATGEQVQEFITLNRVSPLEVVR